MKTYLTYTQRQVSDNTFKEGVALEGKYDLSFFLDYPEYINPLISNVTDGDGFTGKYTTDYKIVEVEHTMTTEQMTEYIATIPAEFNISKLDTNADVANWIKTNTTCEEKSLNIFILQEENLSEMGNTPERLLNLN